MKLKSNIPPHRKNTCPARMVGVHLGIFFSKLENTIAEVGFGVEKPRFFKLHINHQSLVLTQGEKAVHKNRFF